jgi:hypothetical protein
MKIIKSLLLLTIGFCTTSILYAQDVKAEIGKPIELKQPSPAPVLKPQNAVAPTETAIVNEAPSPFKKDEIKNKPDEPKQINKTIDDGTAINPTGADNAKTGNGKTDKPKQIALMPNSNDQSARPLPTTKPAILKKQ